MLNLEGSSRHGAPFHPVRANALMNRRGSFPVLPGLVEACSAHAMQLDSRQLQVIYKYSDCGCSTLLFYLSCNLEPELD